MENDYYKHFEYKNNINKIPLPELRFKASKVIKENIDTTTFKRVNYKIY
jgi:hypothetical protein